MAGAAPRAPLTSFMQAYYEASLRDFSGDCHGHSLPVLIRARSLDEAREHLEARGLQVLQVSYVLPL
jgi:hypothetical protein